MVNNSIHFSDDVIADGTRRWWGRYMSEECKERGYDAEAAAEAGAQYRIYATEAKRRGINPFAGVPYPEQAWPADFYREAVERGEIKAAF